jgi:hypothetical protein
MYFKFFAYNTINRTVISNPKNGNSSEGANIEGIISNIICATV